MKLDRKNWFLPPTLNRSSSVKHGFAKLLPFYFTARGRPLSKSRGPWPTGVGGPWKPKSLNLPYHKLSLNFSIVNFSAEPKTDFNYSFQKFLVISMTEFSVSITFLKTDFSSLIFLPSPVGCSLLISTLISPDSSLSANSSCQEVSRSYLLLKDKKYDFFVYRIPFLQKLCSFL